MKSTRTIISALAVLLSCSALAQTSLFNPATGVLDIPCIALYRNGIALGSNGVPLKYKVQLRALTSEQFSLASIVPTTAIDECLGHFDEQSNLYTDTVNLGDTAYQVVLMHVGNGVFKLDSFQASGPAKTTLWVVTNGSNTLYLGGTIHLLRASDHPIPRAFAEAYAKAKTVYFEVDLDDPLESGSGLTIAQVVASLLDRESKTLQQVLQPDTYRALVSYLASWNIPVVNVQNWAAQRLVSVLATQEVTTNASYESALGVDNFFAAKAKADGRTVLGLETSALQQSVLQELNEGREDQLVREALADFASGKIFTELNELVTAWRNGDLVRLAKSGESTRAESQRDYELILLNRHNAWVPQLEALLATSETEMVLVGAAHMPGPEGLLEMLKVRGYGVRKY